MGTHETLTTLRSPILNKDCDECREEPCATCYFCHAIVSFADTHQPDGYRFKNAAEALLTGLAQAGVSAIELVLPNQRVSTVSGSSVHVARWRARFGSWGAAELILYQVPVGAGTELVSEEIRLSTAAQLAIFSLCSWYQDFNGLQSCALPDRLAEDLARDRLTNALNRDGLMIALDQAIRGPDKGQPFAVFLFDVDNFKIVNDTYGHRVGDALLVEITRSVQDVVGVAGTVARFGGDEFCVITHDAGSERQIAALASDVRDAIGRIETALGVPLQTTVSIGAALVADRETTAEEVLQRADLAMYSAKSFGKNAFRLYDTRLAVAVQREFDIANALRAPGFTSELYVVYQPIVDLTTMLPVKAEALVRWQRAEEHMIDTEALIELTHRYNVYDKLQERVLDIVLKDLAILRGTPFSHLPVSLNITATELFDLSWQDQLIAKAEAAQTPLDTLCFEITEQNQIDDAVAQSHGNFKVLDLGAKLSLDDFGAGYASFKRIGALPFGELKIDRSLTGSLLADTDETKIVTAICSLARELKLDVVGEGCETADQVDALIAAGCRFGQGWYFGRPMGFSAYCAVLQDEMDHEPK